MNYNQERLSLGDKLSPVLMADFYKFSHPQQYPKGTEFVYSTWTPRTSRIEGVDHVVCYGPQKLVQFLDTFFHNNFFSREIGPIVEEYKRFFTHTMGIEADTTMIEELHEVGHLPLKIQALPEGCLVPLRVPYMTIINTDKRFFWLTNFIETLASCELWHMATSATLAYEYRKLLDDYAFKTSDIPEFVDFQGHDFSMRGMSGLNSSMDSSSGAMLSFKGTDNAPAILFLGHYYDADISNELVGASIPATEHSVMCAHGQDERSTILYLINEVYPTGMVSIVLDTWDYFKVLREIIPSLKKEILARDGKVVIRPDSGDPVKIICGTAKEFKSVEEAHNHYSYTYDTAGLKMSSIPTIRVGDEFYRQNMMKSSVCLVRATKGSVTLEEMGSIHALWNIFGGTVNTKGYKQLHDNIGLIYGDAITIKRCKQICEQLESAGFASTNLVYGIGSFTYQYNTRDTFGFAQKSTYCQINGDEKMIFKDPKTDNGVKKSQRGLVAVLENEHSGELIFKDGYTKETMPDTLMHTIYEDGKAYNRQTLSMIRAKLGTT